MYFGLSIKKRKPILLVNSVKSYRWKSSANDVAYELFELAACGHIWTNTSRYFDKLYKRIIQTPSHNTVRYGIFEINLQNCELIDGGLTGVSFGRGR